MRAQEEKKEYPYKKGEFLQKSANQQLYLALKSLLEPYKTGKVLIESLHFYDTQSNESFNQYITISAPQNKHYLEIDSLNNRVSCAVGIKNLGFEE